MLSARVDDETRQQSLAAGANCYLTKPAESGQLTSELRDQIARRAGGGPA
jgi:DNA-binding response OmpR family regulator